MIKQIFCLMVLLFLVSCNSTKPVTQTYKKSTTPAKKTVVYTKTPSANGVATKRLEVVNQYIEQYKGIAMSNMKNFGIPASIILAQGILESGAGKSSLAVNSNNHFGIKCHNDWEGEVVHQDDDSEKECFRKYEDPAGSYKDHSKFLTTKKRYASLFSLAKGDYVAWAMGLRAAGYATDPLYPEKLIAYIERYDLHQYDSQVLGKSVMSAPISNRVDNQVVNGDGTLYEVQKGDTLYSISKKFNVLVEDLQRKNNLTDNAISIGQKLIVK